MKAAVLVQNADQWCQKKKLRKGVKKKKNIIKLMCTLLQVIWELLCTLCMFVGEKMNMCKVRI